MKENVKINAPIGEISLKDLVYGICAHLTCALFAFFMARTSISGLIPFGISVISACPQVLLPGAVLGCVAGYMFPASGIGMFRYIAACLAVLAIKVMCSAISKVGKKVLFMCATTLAVTLATGLVTLNDVEYAPVYAAVEALLAAGGTYFAHYAFLAVRRRNSVNRTKVFCSFIIVLALAAAGALPISIGYISVGRVLFTAIILSCARFGGITGGMAAGIATCAASALTGGGANVSLMYALGGLVAGMLREKGRYIQLLGYLVTALLCALSGGITAQNVAPCVEVFFGATIFLNLPRAVNLKLGRLLSLGAAVNAPVSLKKAVTMRLSFAATALKDVSLTVEQVARELSKINTPEPISIIRGTQYTACKGCVMSQICWDEKKEDTVFALGEIMNAVKQGKEEPLNSAPKEFNERCLRGEVIVNALDIAFADYAAKSAAENRLDEVRAVVCDQFDGISGMLSDIVSELDNDEQYDTAAAARVADALKEIGICPTQCVCRTDKYGRLSIEATAPDNGFGLINKLKIMRVASNVCDRDFEAPDVVRCGGEMVLTLNERARYTAEIGAEQIICKGSTMCGDSYNWFYDGRGRIVVILSDGMGAGGRAAVDSAMATGLMSRLIKAGFGFDCSLRILNSSMLFKSTDESLATVDISCIDLFTGQIELLKAGAAPTIVRRRGRTGKAQSTSLPAGIIREIGFDKATVKIHSGDILLMMSDGVTAQGTDWIYEELENWGNGTAQALSERIANEAKRRRTDGHEDDITVIAAIIERA